MLLQCEICHNKKSEIAKIPCGYYLDKYDNGELIFIMPTDEEAYRDVCLDCLLKL